MAELGPQNYEEQRPAEFFAPFHERVRTRKPGFVYEITRVIVTPITLTFYRARAIGTENVPATGEVVLSPNHFSQMDHFLLGVYLRRKVHFLAKSQLFSHRLGNRLFNNGGVFPVRRGRRDEEAFISAQAILDRGDCLGMYAEGGRSRTRNLGDPKRGIGKLALSTGARIVPVAIHGSAGAREWTRLRFPKVTIQYGEPMRFAVEADPSPERQQEVSEQIFDQVRTMYTALDERGRSGVLKALREGVRAPDPGRASPES